MNLLKKIHIANMKQRISYLNQEAKLLQQQLDQIGEKAIKKESEYSDNRSCTRTIGSASIEKLSNDDIIRT